MPAPPAPAPALVLSGQQGGTVCGPGASFIQAPWVPYHPRAQATLSFLLGIRNQGKVLLPSLGGSGRCPLS